METRSSIFYECVGVQVKEIFEFMNTAVYRRAKTVVNTTLNVCTSVSSEHI